MSFLINSLTKLANISFRVGKNLRTKLAKISSQLDKYSDENSQRSNQSSSFSSSHYHNNVSFCNMLAIRSLRAFNFCIKNLSNDFGMFICSFCELFLLIFILLYAFYQSWWLLFFIGAGILG